MKRNLSRLFVSSLVLSLVILSSANGQTIQELHKRVVRRLQTTFAAQTSWPQARGYATMLYDPWFWRILMLGGEAAPEPDWASGLVGNGGVWSFQPAPGKWKVVVNSIPVNFDTAVTYDIWAHRVIVFRSYNPNPQSPNLLGMDFVSETWAYDPLTGIWEHRHPVQSPPPGLLAGGSQIAYNARWGKTIMFGGWDLFVFEKWLESCGPDFSTCDDSLLPLMVQNHTWVYDYFANTWTDMAPAVSPAARNSLSLAYDLAADRVILFGGGDWFVDYDDTWAYDYRHNTWTELHSAIHPDARCYGELAYNSLQDRLVLFGGVDYTETILYGDTWVFNYWDQTWRLQNPTTSPSPRGWISMAYSPIHNAVVIFGGGVDRDHFTDETWEYNLAANRWVQVPKPQ